MKDPYVAEVRKYRMQHTKACGSDLHRIGEDLREFERSLGARVVAPNVGGAQKKRPGRRFAACR